MRVFNYCCVRLFLLKEILLASLIVMMYAVVYCFAVIYESYFKLCVMFCEDVFFSAKFIWKCSGLCSTPRFYNRGLMSTFFFLIY